MNSSIITLDPVTARDPAKTILSKNGFACSLLTLAPGEETPVREADQFEEHLLFLLEGQATVSSDQVNTILHKDEALLLPRGKQHVISAQSNGAAKLLRVDVPPRQVVMPQIISFDQ